MLLPSKRMRLSLRHSECSPRPSLIHRLVRHERRQVPHSLLWSNLVRVRILLILLPPSLKVPHLKSLVRRLRQNLFTILKYLDTPGQRSHSTTSGVQAFSYGFRLHYRCCQLFPHEDGDSSPGIRHGTWYMINLGNPLFRLGGSLHYYI